jgi:hypothetical protein
LEFPIFLTIFSKLKNGQSGGLNAKTCLAAGLGGRKVSILGRF